MGLRKYVFILVAMLSLAISAQKREVKSQVGIIPEPVSITECGKDTFAVVYNTPVKVSGEELLNSANYLVDYMQRHLGVPLRVEPVKVQKKRQPEPKSISLVNLRNGKVSGGYHLRVDAAKGVSIEGNDAAGVFYGVQTLIQMLPTQAGIVPRLPEVEIADYPRFAYRGMHLDVVRHFFPVEFVKRYIDFLALHKMNYFHWHLTDDQGWRVEMKSRPELTSKGSMREGEIEGMFPGEYKPLPYAAYYTQEQIKEVVDYAARRYVAVIPEIDVPGHCMAVLATYPQFSTTPDQPKKCALTWGIYNRHNNVLAPKPEVFAFLKDVFSELCDLFPGQYIHVGGDECAKRWWQESEETQQFMRQHNLKDEKALQSYFIHYVQSVVNSKGKTLIGWDEILEGGISKDCVVMNWRDQKHGVNALQTGHRTIFCNTQWSYINKNESRVGSVLGGRGPLSLEEVYKSEILPDSLSAEQSELVWGAQGCMWTEYAPTTWKVEYWLFPRLSALAENMWSVDGKKDWDKFARKMLTQYDRYDLWGARYSEAFLLREDIVRNR